MSVPSIDELRALLSEVVGKDAGDIQSEDDLVENLGIDSLTGLKYLAVVEKRYDVRFPDRQLSNIRTLARVRDLMLEGGEGEGK